MGFLPNGTNAYISLLLVVDRYQCYNILGYNHHICYCPSQSCVYNDLTHTESYI